MISQSGAVSPSSKPSIGSVLVTKVIPQVGSGSQLSGASTLTVIDAILWFGGHKTSGFAGGLNPRGVASTTAISTVSGGDSPGPLLTTRVMGYTSIGD